MANIKQIIYVVSLDNNGQFTVSERGHWRAAEIIRNAAKCATQCAAFTRKEDADRYAQAMNQNREIDYDKMVSRISSRMNDLRFLDRDFIIMLRPDDLNDTKRARIRLIYSRIIGTEYPRKAAMDVSES